jgi:hypothetical protein
VNAPATAINPRWLAGKAYLPRRSVVGLVVLTVLIATVAAWFDQPLLPVLALLGAGAAALAIWRPMWAFYALVMLLPIRAVPLKLMGFYVHPYRVVLVLLFLALIIQVRADWYRALLRARLTYPLLTLTVVAGATVFVAFDRGLWLKAFLQMLACLGVYVVTVLLVNREARFTAVCRCLALTGMVHALIGIGDYGAALAGLPSLTIPAQVTSYLAPPRAQGLMADPNFYMMVLLALLPLTLAWATAFSTGWRRHLWVPAVLLYTALVPMTSSRGGLVATALLLATGALLSRGRRGLLGSRQFEVNWLQAALLGLALCMGGIALVFAVSPLHAVRALQSIDLSDLSKLSEGRFDVYLRILTSFVHHPLGIGLYNTVAVAADIGKFAHNSLLQVMAEMGVPGLLAYGWLFLVTLGEIRRFSHGSRYSVWLVALGLGILGVYYSGLFISTYYDEILALLWGLVAAGVALAQREREDAIPAIKAATSVGDLTAGGG